MRSYRHHLLALVGYLLLTLGLTYPLARHFFEAIPGDGFDGWQNVWNIWWIKHALLVQGTHPYFTQLVDYPSGVYLYFHTLNIFNGLTFLPITLNLGQLVAYNVAVVFSFAMGGYGGYLLALHSLLTVRPAVSSDRPARGGLGFNGHREWRHLAAFAGGVVFSFSPYHMAHLLGHMQLISLEWLPFYALFVVNLLSHPRPLSAGGRRYVGLTALFLVLVAACDWYYAFYMVLFSLLCWLWCLWRRRDRLVPTLALGAVGLLFLLAVSPVLVPMVREAATADYMVPPAGSAERLSADLSAFFTPSELHPVWGAWAGQWASRFTSTTSERTVFAGYSVLVLAGLALWFRRGPAAFWGVTALVFAILALGPELHIGGQTQWAGIGPIPLPYALLQQAVPLLNISRSVSRFDVMVMLSLGVLTALGLNGLLERIWAKTPKRLAPRALGLGALGLVCLEFLAVPYPMSAPETRPFHYQMAQEADEYAVMDIPMDWDRPANLLYQTVHRKPMVSGYTSRDNPLAPAGRTPVLQTFRYLGPDINSGDARSLAATVLNDLGVRYVIVHKNDLPPGAYRENTLALVEEVFGGWPLVMEDDWLKVLRVPKQPARPLPYLTLGDGWSARQWQAGRPQRLMRALPATLIARLPAAQRLRLALEAYSLEGSDAIEIGAGKEALGTYPVGGQPTILITPLFDLPAGQSVIELRNRSGRGNLAVTQVWLSEQ